MKKNVKYVKVEVKKMISPFDYVFENESVPYCDKCGYLLIPECKYCSKCGNMIIWKDKFEPKQGE